MTFLDDGFWLKGHSPKMARKKGQQKSWKFPHRQISWETWWTNVNYAFHQALVRSRFSTFSTFSQLSAKPSPRKPLIAKRIGWTLGGEWPTIWVLGDGWRWNFSKVSKGVKIGKNVCVFVLCCVFYTVKNMIVPPQFVDFYSIFTYLCYAHGFWVPNSPNLPIVTGEAGHGNQPQCNCEFMPTVKIGYVY